MCHCLEDLYMESGHGIFIRPIAHWRQFSFNFKIQQQASTPSISAGRVADTCYQCLHSHSSNTHTHTAVQCVLPYWQSLETWGQVVKIASSTKSFDTLSFGVLFLLVLMLHCWRRKKSCAKEEECFFVELTLKYQPHWDRPFLMFWSEARVAPPCSCCECSIHQASKIGSTLPCISSFWHEVTKIRMSCWVAQTLHTWYSSRIFHHHWHAAWKPMFRCLVCDGPNHLSLCCSCN